MHGYGALYFQAKPTKEAAKEALSHINQALALCPDTARFHNSKAVVLEKTGDIAGAQEAFQRAIDLQPSNPKWMVNLAKLLKAKNEFQKALDLMLKVAELDPKHLEINYKIGTLYKAMGNKDKAVEYFKKHTAVDPTHDYARFWVSALTGEGQKDVFKPEMVARLFDSYADSFDTHLTVTLGTHTYLYIVERVRVNYIFSHSHSPFLL